MKKYRLNFLVALLGGGLFLASCGSNSENAHKTEETSEKGKEYNSTYVCPMHCEGSGSEEMGDCPVCGMDYVKNENATHHDH
ncbi:MAG: heavy metal-binding domain-containing protein [Brumimicrobium sp.]